MFMGPAFRDLLVALKQPATGCRAALVRSSLVLAREMLHDVNCLFEASLDLYALQFIPCIWGKVLRYERRLVVAVCSGVHEVHRVSKAIYKSSRRRDRDRLMFLESKAICEFHVGAQRLQLKDQILEVSARTLRKVIDVISSARHRRGQWVHVRAIRRGWRCNYGACVEFIPFDVLPRDQA